MMKKLIWISLFSIVLAVTIVSCAKTDTTPSTSGDDRAKFLGDWSVNEIHSKNTYIVTIRSDPNESTRILIDNFGNLISSYSASGYVSGNNIYLDADQHVGSMTILSGSGTMSGTTKISWTYSMTDGATRIDATATYTKK
jgi:hypothetical protein